MIIIVGHKGSVDLESQQEMTPEQKEHFLNFFKANYKAVLVKETSRFRRIRLGADKMFARKFIDGEIPYLLDLDYDVDDVAEMLGRPRMSVAKKRGELLPAFMEWMQDIGRDIIKEDIKVLVADFIKYKKQQKEAKKKKSQEKRAKSKEIKELEAELALWQSQKRRDEIELYVKVKQPGYTADEHIQNKIKSIKEKLDKLSKS